MPTKAKKGKVKGKKAGKAKAGGKKKGLTKKEKMKRLIVISKAWAYGAQNDMIDLERSTKVMSAATLDEVKAVMRLLKSTEKNTATDEGRPAKEWAAGPTSLKDTDSVILFDQLDAKAKRGKVDLMGFLDKCVSTIKVKTEDKKETEHQIAEKKRIKKYAEMDWSSRDEMISVWPAYVRSKLQIEAERKKVSNDIVIDWFNMKLPLSKEYLLENTSLEIKSRKKIALIGEPGSGKSVLFHSMAHADTEIKYFPDHISVHHMEELEVSPDAESLLKTVVNMHPFLLALRRSKVELVNRIEAKGDHKEPSATAKAAMESNLAYVEEQLGLLKNDEAEERAAKSLRALGFDDTAQQKSINTLSGGLRMRVALCAAFFVDADLLLLDEPTNHLDFPSLLWLEHSLKTYRKSLMVVCHDREILNNICTNVILITLEKKLKTYDMGFIEYEKVRWAAEAKMAKDTEKFLKRNRNIDFASPLAREAAKRKAWLDAYARRMVLRAGQFTFPAPIELIPDNEQKGTTPDRDDISVIKVTDVRFSYDAETLPFIFDQKISIDINMGTRMGVMGPNGAGKSTFLKLLTGNLHPVEGTITTNKNAKVAYFSQHHSLEMDLNLTPMDFMISKFPEENIGQLRLHLGKVGCTGDLTNTCMKGLSQGLRSCILFAKITYKCPHLLIMDEPTNFLDIETVDALISATNKYRGALLLVSHSRLFLKKCAHAYLSIVPGSFDVYPDLAECERATYAFVADLQEGGKVRIGEGNLATSAGSNSMSKKEPEKPKSSDGIMMF